MSKQHTLKVYVGGEVFDDLATTSAMMITMHELLIPLAIPLRKFIRQKFV